MKDKAGGRKRAGKNEWERETDGKKRGEGEEGMGGSMVECSGASKKRSGILRNDRKVGYYNNDGDMGGGEGLGAIRGKLPKGFIWEMQAARRDSNKGREKGGMVAGVTKELVGREAKGG